LNFLSLTCCSILGLFFLVAPRLEAEELEFAPNILFWSPEQRAAGFPSIERFYPVRRVEQSVSALPLVTKKLSQDRLNGFEYRFDLLNEETVVSGGVAGYMKRMPTAGLIAVQGRDVLLERYSLGHQMDKRWISFSVTKSVVSLLVGAAIKDGYIKSANDKAVVYLPELRGGSYQDSRIKDLLQMSSGVAWNEDYDNSASDIVKAPVVGMPLFRYMSDLPRTGKTGTVWNYNTNETNLIGEILSRAIDQDLSVYLENKIWHPYGMESEANWMLTYQNGLEYGGCCLSATLRDYARLGLFVLDELKKAPNDDSVLPPGWMRESLSPAQAFNGYGYFWWLLGDGIYAAEGIFGQVIWIDSKNNLVIALQSSWRQAWSDSLEAEWMAFMGALSKELLAGNKL